MNVFQLWELFLRLQQGCGTTPSLACIVQHGITELEPLLRDYFTVEIQGRVGEGFRPGGASTVRLFEIFEALKSCGPRNYVCMVGLGISEIEAALRATLLAAIPMILTDPAEGEASPKFDDRAIPTSRLAEIHDAIDGRSADSFPTWSRLAQFPEIEEMVRDRQLETTFRNLRASLHGEDEENVSLETRTDQYRRAIEAAFSVTFAIQAPHDYADVNAQEMLQLEEAWYDWELGAIHFARLGLDAVANAFERWVEGQFETPPGEEPRPRRWLNRFRIFRSIMGSMAFKHASILASNFAESHGHFIRINPRPEVADYWVYKDDAKNWHYVISQDQPPEYDGSKGSEDYRLFNKPVYQGVYEGSHMVPANRQAVLSPNNLIHELGHSVGRYGGFGDAGVGSLEYAMGVAGMPNDRAGMGAPLRAEYYYQHASVIHDPDPDGNAKGLAAFQKLDAALDIPFGDSDFLNYDLFGKRYWLWASDYNPLKPYKLTARVDVFIHNPSKTPTETAADSFLNWVRGTFDTSIDGTKWTNFFAANIGIVLRNAVFHQKLYYKEDLNAIISHYQSRGFIGEPVFGKVAAKTPYLLRKAPDVGSLALGNAGTSGLLDVVNVPIYGWYRPPNGIPKDPSPYWFLVSTVTGELAWLASLALTEYDTQALMSKPEINIDNLSPARPFRFEDLDIILA